MKQNDLFEIREYLLELGQSMDKLIQHNSQVHNVTYDNLIREICKQKTSEIEIIEPYKPTIIPKSKKMSFSDFWED